MTYYYQLIFLLLAAGHIYCVDHEEFLLKDGSTFEYSWSKKSVQDIVLNGTHIKKMITYDVRGFNKIKDNRKFSSYSTDIVSVSKLQLKDRHRHVENCHAYRVSPYWPVRDEKFDNLQKDILDDACKNYAHVDNGMIDTYEDKNNELKNSVISQLKYMQARDGFDTVIDAALLLARQNFKNKDFIEFPSMSLGLFELVKDVVLRNLSTTTRVGSVQISNKSDVLAFKVLLKMEPQINFNATIPLPLMPTARIEAHAPKTVVGATIKLDYSKEKCRIEVDDFKLDLNDSLSINFVNGLANLAFKPVTSAAKIAVEKYLQPVYIEPQMKTYLETYLNKYVNCEDLKPMNRW